MAAIEVDPAHVHEFVDADAFYDWLSRHHDKQTEVWIKIHKVGSGLPSINAKQAIDVVLCWGWIDAVRKSFDEQSFLQRYTPRGRKSIWSQINVDNVARLIAEGRMTQHGLREVEAAKADGRWDKRLRQRQGHEDPRRSAGRDRRQPEGQGDAGQADRTEPLRPGLPHPQHEDGSRPQEEDRDLRGHAGARRDDLSAEEAR
jgi:hypothetical protein